ncbi:ABC-type transport system involved in multi-copper enzyme maturation permease subunit [Hamadaea flava]|uniref:ABC transporter permease n=1 Tax=Hamadaea flava TaxID=1742688 RepID=A0ABV8LLT9_9ACTN|nr:ABC transporter permease [Hamadaea flava]MCP2324167.1 ABC-type transport system involved in multi-copper enzyme maturation permease subunit [Hamadaea flava]
MNTLIKAEIRRLLATRIWRGLLLAATLLGGGMVGAMALVGPENFQPPMPGLDTEPGVRSILGILGYTAFIPAAVGTLAVTSEYRHRTAAVTFLFAPRRSLVLGAKLIAYGLAGLAFGLILSGTAAIALFGVAAARGVPLGLPNLTVIGLLARIGVAMAAYLLIGVGVGALVRHQVVALSVVIGYLYLGETLLMLIPGVNRLYPFLPGGATASLTDFTYLAEAISQQTSMAPVSLLSPVAGALVLLAYAMSAAVAALMVPMRRDVT